MQNLVDKIWKNNESIFLIQGNDNLKITLLREIDHYLGGIVTIPKLFLEFDPMNEEEEEDFLDCITVRILIADFFIIYLENFNEVSGSKVKELVTDDFFQSFNNLLDRNSLPQKRKLIVVSETSPEDSIFLKEKSLKFRCKILNLCNK
jgi:hypothetical protein